MAEELDDPAVMKVEECAKLLRISRGAAYQAVKRGQIPGVLKIGRSVRVSRPALLSWLNQGGVVQKAE